MCFITRVGACLAVAGMLAGIEAAAAKNPDIKPVSSKKEKSIKGGSAAPQGGVRTPGVLIPLASLKSEAEISVEAPGTIAVADDVVMVDSKGSVLRIDARTNKPLDPVSGLKKACSGTIAAFGSLWIPDCEAQAVTRVDLKSQKITATLPTGAADVTTGIAATADSVWMLTDNRTTLSRIDPQGNQVVGEIRLPQGCDAILSGNGSLWVPCPSENKLYRINPETNLVEERIEVSAGPRALALGDNSVWVLCDKEGKVDRVDPKTNKVTKTIALNVANGGGTLAFGDGYLWVTQSGFPIARIDTKTESVDQQFWAPAGNFNRSLITTSNGAIWLTDPTHGKVLRFDPKRILATLAE